MNDARSTHRTRKAMGRAWAALVLTARFTRSVVVSGLQTVRIILQPSRARSDDLQAHFVRFTYAPMRPAGAAMLASLVSLTPGSTVVAINTERKELLLHLLDPHSAQALAQEIRRDFEPPLMAWFAEDRA